MKPGISQPPKQGVQHAHQNRLPDGSILSMERQLSTSATMPGIEKIQKCSFRTQRCLKVLGWSYPQWKIHILTLVLWCNNQKNEASQVWFHLSLGRYVLSDFSLWSSTELPSPQALRQSSQQLQQNFLLVKLCPFKISIPVHSMPKESMLVKSKIIHLKVLPTIPILMVPEMISKMEDRLAALPPGSHRPWRAVPVAAVVRHRPSGAPSGENEKLV